MAIADELIGVLGYKLEGEENLKKYQDGLDRTEQGAEASAARIRKIGVAAGAITAAGIAFTGAAIRNFAGFEREMTRIGITADATALETAAAADTVQRYAKDFALPLDQAVAGLETLVASGMALHEAMAFLPSVLATAQASGAATQDIANTAQKAASALGLEAEQMQRAFDIMVSGGKAGQFELRDMAQYIPELANLFSSLGYSGEDGLQKLIALLQTVREDTGSASGAATQLRNVFAKMNTEQTAKAFADFGIDLRGSLEAARAGGEDVLDTFVKLSRQAIDGDLSKLPLLFRDQEFLLGMQSLITSQESFDRFLAAVTGAKVEGTVFRDVNRVLADTDAQITRVSRSWDTFVKSFGRVASDPVGSLLDDLSNELDLGSAIRRQLETEGMGYWEREAWLLRNRFFNDEEVLKKGRQGGYVPADDPVARATAETAPFAYKSLGRLPRRPTSTGSARALEEADRDDAAHRAKTYGRQFGFDVAADFEEGVRDGASDRRILAAKEAQVGQPDLPPIDPSLSFADRFRESNRRTFDTGVFKREEGEKDQSVIQRMLAGMTEIANSTEPETISDIAIVPEPMPSSVETQQLIPQTVPTSVAPGAGVDAQLQEIASRIEGMNSHLAQMTGDAAVEAVITDARTDARDMSVTVNSTVNQTVQQATQAPAAAAQATSQAVGRAAPQAAVRVERSSAF